MTHEDIYKNWQVDNLFIGGSHKTPIGAEATFTEDLEFIPSPSSSTPASRSRKSDRFGMSYIQVWTDPRTRAVELFSMREITEEASIPNILNMWGRYGDMNVVSSDRGSDFTSTMIEGALKLTADLHRTGVANRPQSQGIVERTNGEVLRHIRAMVIEVPEIQDTWSWYLPIVRNRLWLSVNRFTLVRPVDFFGGALRMQMKFRSPSEIGCDDQPIHPTIAEIASNSEKIRIISLRNQHAADLQKLAGKARRNTIFKIGSLVLLLPNPNAATSLRPVKIAPVVSGPFEVIKQEGSRIVLRDLIDLHTLEPVHIERVFPFRSSGRIDPRTWEARKRNVFLVDEIIDWRVIIAENYGICFLHEVIHHFVRHYGGGSRTFKLLPNKVLEIHDVHIIPASENDKGTRARLFKPWAY